jgi:ankyrin repeat protein
VLLEHGANVGAVDNEGRTPLHAAAEGGKVKVVRVLLEHGANVDAVDNEGRTSLHTRRRWNIATSRSYACCSSMVRM